MDDNLFDKDFLELRKIIAIFIAGKVKQSGKSDALAESEAEAVLQMADPFLIIVQRALVAMEHIAYAKNS
jgi:hypothetical protein